MGRKRRRRVRREDDSIFWPRRHVRIWRRLQFKIWKFVQRSFGKCVAVFLTTIIVLSSFMGCSIGKSRAEKKADEAQKVLVTKHKKETKKLEESLKKAQRENPEERPWNLTLVNDTHPMDEGYVPKLAALDDKNEVDERILEPLKKMLDDAQKAGLSMYVCSSYRSVDRQKELYDQYMKTAVNEGKSYWAALEETRLGTTYPGRSEHGMGLAVDIISNKYTKLDEKQQETAEAKWLAANCYKYGFILRYPVDKTDITKVKFEPWHYRYVGVEDATKITEQGLTLEEYLGEVH